MKEKVQKINGGNCPLLHNLALPMMKHNREQHKINKLSDNSYR